MGNAGLNFSCTAEKGRLVDMSMGFHLRIYGCFHLNCLTHQLINLSTMAKPGFGFNYKL